MNTVTILSCSVYLKFKLIEFNESELADDIPSTNLREIKF
jgi:hypothetical protein